MCCSSRERLLRKWNPLVHVQHSASIRKCWLQLVRLFCPGFWLEQQSKRKRLRKMRRSKKRRKKLR